MRGLMQIALLLCVALANNHAAGAANSSQQLSTVDKILPVKKVKLVFNATQAKLIEHRNKPKLDFVPQGTRPQSAMAGEARIVPNSQIIGGFRAARGQFPWQVFIAMDQSSSCGGSLINPQWVLTAAHCVQGFSEFMVTLGSAKRNIVETGRVQVVTRTKVVHGKYNENNLEHDIALLKLPTPINISGPFINTIRMPRVYDATQTFVNANAVVSGWGKTSDSGTVSVQLNFVSVPVIPNLNCTAVYGTEYIKSTMMCVSGLNNKGICSGDSGGPLIFKEIDGRWTQIGIVSFSAYSCYGYPQGFTRVTSYLGWISAATGIQFRT